MATVNTLSSTKNVERILTELENNFNEFSRVTGILRSRTIAPERKKLVDQSRWRRKFKSIFDWHKCLDFDKVEPGKASANVFARTGEVTSLEPMARTDSGL